MSLNYRAIESKDNGSIKNIIESVMPEFGATGEGFAIEDPEVQAMFEAYSGDGRCYFVVEDQGQVIGGSGIAPLKGGDPSVCELQKMYVLSEGRGRGIGAHLMKLCLNAAKEMKYKQCYLETLIHMEDARRLYEKVGFQPLEGPMGNTGHFGCNHWYIKDL